MDAPPVLPLPAPAPIAIFSHPAFVFRAALPIAVLARPDTLLPPASTPTNTLLSPVVLAVPALLPIITLLPPVVIASPAAGPITTLPLFGVGDDGGFPI